jgi:opacity protein-like surface antigen
MKKLAIAASIAVSVSKAFAADLRTRLQIKAPLVAPGFSWSGFYISGSGQGLLTSDASARDALTGLPFHRGITNGGSGIFTTVSPGYDKSAYRRRAGQLRFRQPSGNVFIANGSEQLRSAGRKGAIGFRAGARRSDPLAA